MQEEIKRDHILQSAWSVTYVHKNITKNQKKEDLWNTAIKPICLFKSLEESKYFIENIPLPSEWPINSNLQIFREGIKPSWEDPMNQRVTRLSIKLEIDITDNSTFSIPSFNEESIELYNFSDALNLELKKCVNRLFKEIFFFVVSESFGIKSDLINGLVYSPRRINPRIFLWMRTDDIFERQNIEFEIQLKKLIEEKKLLEYEINGKKYKIRTSFVFDTNERSRFKRHE